MLPGCSNRRVLASLIVSHLISNSWSIFTRWDIGQDGREMIYTQAPMKRDAEICAGGLFLCPASLSGGCCPTDLSCGTDSCYPTTTPPAGIVTCGLDQGGGWCPSGYSCAANGCIPLVGSCSLACATGSYLCPASLGCGCCKTGLGCGLGYCYQTSFSSVQVTLTVPVTDSNSHVQTITTVIQTAFVPSSVSAIPTTFAATLTISKSTSTATPIAKVPPLSNTQGGLTTAQLGGIIGAAVVVLIVVLIATYLILRRLNAVAKASSASGSGSGSKNKPQNPNGKKPSLPRNGGLDYDALSVDPLMMSPSSAATTPRLFRPTAIPHSSSESRMASPPIPAPYSAAHIYQPVPASESQYSDHHRARQHSNESSPPAVISPPVNWYPDGYFGPDPALRDQNLRHGHMPTRPTMQSSHERQWSDVSETSQNSNSSGGLVELDARSDAGQNSALQRMGLSRPSNSHRRHSSELRLLGHTRKRSSGSSVGLGVELPTGVQAGRRLENVEETGQDRSPAAGPSGGARNEASGKIPGPPKGQSHTEPGMKGETFEAIDLGTSRIVTQEALDLELELQRLEGQKIMGTGMDMVRGRR